MIMSINSKVEYETGSGCHRVHDSSIGWGMSAGRVRVSKLMPVRGPVLLFGPITISLS